MTNHVFPNQRPGVLLWFKIYCGFLCLTYLAVVAGSLFLLLGDPQGMDMDQTEARIMGAFLLLIGVVFFVACLLPLVLEPRPWLWIYDLVVICVGMTSACFLPICVPLLIFWLKPEVKRYFGKE